MSRRRRPAAFDGLLPVDKPSGPTSHDVVQTVRRLLGQRQVGHTGTLDPPATGLLPLVLGRATRLARFLPDSPKRYEGTLRLGWTSSTDDAAGELSRGPAPVPGDAGRVLEAARALVGPQRQRPPAVSAKRLGGRRLHDLARAGLAVEAAPVAVTVHELRLEPTGAPERWRYRAAVSAGTYVRALARDLGAALGCGGLVESLRRTSIGPLGLEGAVGWASGEEPSAERLVAGIVPLERLALAMPAIRLTDTDAATRLRHGSAVDPAAAEPDPRFAETATDDALRRVADVDGGLLGVARLDDGALRPKLVIPQPAENV